MKKLYNNVIRLTTIGLAGASILIGIILISHVVSWEIDLFFRLFDICHCEGDNLPRFVFDYNILGEGVQPAYHFKNIIRIPDITRMLKGQAGIYLWHNTINGDIYVGSAIDLFNRTSDYGQPAYLASSTHSRILNSLNKYPLENWDLIIIVIIQLTGDIVTDRNNIINTETYWITTLKANLNLSKEGRSSLGRKHPQEVINKLSEKLGGENNPNYGKKHTDEARVLMSKAKSRIVYKFKENGILVEKYLSQAQAAKENGITQSSMSRKIISAKPINGFYYSYDSKFIKR